MQAPACMHESVPYLMMMGMRSHHRSMLYIWCRVLVGGMETSDINENGALPCIPPLR